MKKLTLAEWEEKYITGLVERFDQKYTMFSRPHWDTEIRERLDDWSTGKAASERPGDTLRDQALRAASRRGTMMELFNVSKPNPPQESKAIAAAMAGLSIRMPVMAGLNTRMPAMATANAPALTMAAPGPGTPVVATLEAPKPALNSKPKERPRIDVSDPQSITRDIKKAATYFGADIVGICRLDRRWVYSHTYDYLSPEPVGTPREYMPQEIPEEFQYAVVMAFEEEYDLMQYYTTAIAGVTSSMGYSRMAITNNYLSEFIRNLGFKAIDCSTNDVALSIPLAMQAGLGELGRNGLLVTPQFGPRVRLSKIITDLPLVSDSPIEFGVTEFCVACKKCAQLCSSQSISSDERTVEPNNPSNAAGELKWRIDAETCRMYWSRSKRGCTTCVAVCPYNKPNTWSHKAVQWFTDHARWADPLYIKMDDIFGYGKPQKADDFWQEWQPKRH